MKHTILYGVEGWAYVCDIPLATNVEVMNLKGPKCRLEGVNWCIKTIIDLA
jgi:hypothetical protein